MNKPTISVVRQTVSLSDISPFMLSCMEEGLNVTITVNGSSMRPLLHSHKDAVVLSKPDRENLRRGDVPLYLRDNGQYVLHRLVKVQDNGKYTMLGDAQEQLEPDIRPDQIQAVAAGFHRNGKYVSCSSPPYRAYIWLFMRSRFFRRITRKLDRMRGERQ